MTREEELHAYIAAARWFGGKDRAFSIGEVSDRELAPGVTTTLVEVTYDTGGTDRYQIPLSSYDEPAEHLEHALVGTWDGRWHYDAVHDHDAMHAWLHAFAGAEEDDGAFNGVPGHELDVTAQSALFSGEQSNSSVAFGEDSLMKLFRRISPGVNPDIEVHKVLTEAGSEHVAHLYGWVEVPASSGEPIHLAMLQQFLRTATEGWDFALTSVRNLFAEADLHPEEVGGDFAGEAHRLGVAVAEVHALLRDHFPTSPLDPDRTVAAMRQRLQDTIAIAPELAAVADAAHSAFDRISATTDGVAQRVHGDLHLGQTLRTSLGWKLVDFEGEPARPLADRMLPDSRWRDVAGMLRSFDYAARSVQRDLDVEDEARAQMDYRATEWVQRNRDAFLAGYAEASGPMSGSDLALIEAYELDKAVYEVAYEARNRPAWIDIPLAALARAREGSR